jgi:hypothetical protein
MTHARTILLAAALAAAALATQGSAARAGECEPKSSCFGFQSATASLSTYRAGAHPDLNLDFKLKQDPETPANALGTHLPYAEVRNLRVELPPGLIGDPNVLGAPQQCTTVELVDWNKGGGCPSASQVGTSTIITAEFPRLFVEPIYMMTPPGGDVIARLGLIGGAYPVFVDFKLRSESDYGLTAEILDASPNGRFVEIDTTTWGVPADPSHDTERCTAVEAFNECIESEPRPPGSHPLAFMTNPTFCSGAPEQVGIAAESWQEPERTVSVSAPLAPITGCDKVPFNPSLSVEPTSHRAAAPTGLELSFRLPAPEGVGVLESSALRDIRIAFPPGMGIDTSSADGLATCSAAEVGLETREASHCPDAAKLADAEFDIPALPRRMKGALYLRAPEPGHLFRVWVVADDLGAHIKLPGELEVDEATGQITSVVLGIPQAPVREVRLLVKSGFRAPLVNPPACGTYQTHWEFTPWSGTGTVAGETPMRIDEGCDTGGFAPRLSAGAADPAAGRHSPFLFTLTREDGEGNPEFLDIALPTGLAATFAGIPRCEAAAAQSGACPPASQIGRVLAATGAGPTPLWVPQPGRRPTAVYLGGPYEGAPTSIVAVVPAQAGPFDLGDQVVRSPVFVDPVSGRATARSDALPQIIQGVPVLYRTVDVELDRPGFTLNPTSCAAKATEATITSSTGQSARLASPFQATECGHLPFAPKLSLRLRGSTKRSGNPALTATVRMPAGEANIAAAQVTLPHSEFLDNAHISAPCTRVQFREGGGFGERCPPGSLLGHAAAKTPLFDFPLQGPVYLRSSDHQLPDLVAVLRGPAQMPIAIELDGRIDSSHGGIRNSFEAVPDAPVEEFTLSLAGGKKGLLENAPVGQTKTLCATRNLAIARFTGQNGKTSTFHPELRAAGCGKGHHAHAHHR